MGERGPKKGAKNAGRPAGTRRAIGKLKGAPKRPATKVIAHVIQRLTEADLQHLTFDELVRSITVVRGHPPHVGIVTLLFHALQQYVFFQGRYQQLIANEVANAAHVTDTEWKRLPEIYNETTTGYIVEHPVVTRKVKQADQCAKLLKECMVTPWVQARLVPDKPPPLPPEAEDKDDLKEDWEAGDALPMTPPDDAESSDPANSPRGRKVPRQRAQRKKAGGKARTTRDRKTSAGPG